MTMKLRLLAAVAVTFSILGGAGAGVYFATAADPAQPGKLADPKANPPALVTKSDGRPAPEATAAQADVKGTVAALERPFGVKVNAGLPVSELLNTIETMTDLTVRVDVAAFRRVGALDDHDRDAKPFLTNLYETQVVLPQRVEKLPIRDVLGDALAQVRSPHPCAYQIRGSQLVIVPAYMPPARPGADPLAPDEIEPPIVEFRLLYEQIYGGVVNLSVENKPLTDIIADLHKQTGANIVLDPRCADQAKKATLTVTLNDARLYDALRVIADMAELKMVYAGNIYYVTTPANAKTFQPPTPRPPTLPFPQLPDAGK